MTVIPPISAVQAGQSAGGGFFSNLVSSVTGGASGAGSATGGGLLSSLTGGAAQDPATSGPKGDGSVGLFDGVIGKTLMGAVAGAGIGFIPFIPGGPILGGIVGALGGAAMGLFGNWRKMSAIKKENEATLAALGVQTQDPRVQQILQSGNVQQLIPLVQEEQAAIAAQQAQQGGVVQQGTPQQQAVVQQQAAAQAAGQLPPTVQQGTIQVGSGAQSGGGSGAAVVPGSGGTPGVMPAAAAEAPALVNAVNANGGIDSGPYAITYSYSGGGGAEGDAGRPTAPVDPNAPATTPNSVAEIAPVQAGVTPQADATPAATAEAIAAMSPTQVGELIMKLQQEIEQLKAMLAQIRADEEAVAQQQAA